MSKYTEFLDTLIDRAKRNKEMEKGNAHEEDVKTEQVMQSDRTLFYYHLSQYALSMTSSIQWDFIQALTSICKTQQEAIEKLIENTATPFEERKEFIDKLKESFEKAQEIYEKEKEQHRDELDDLYR